MSGREGALGCCVVAALPGRAHHTADCRPCAHLAQVSRRLARRLYYDLHRGRLGYVKLGVEAYAFLLAAPPPQKCSLFANELVVRSVVSRCEWVWVGAVCARRVPVLVHAKRELCPDM